ncbi:MAG: S49 family peptidase [Rhizobiaceae bacterium]|nr:S49 family peptidase [Rhizobiaceae bacterium]
MNTETEPASQTTLSSDLLYMRIAGLVFGKPLLIAPNAAETVGLYLRSRMEGAGPDANSFVGQEQADRDGRWRGYRKVGSVGIVSILGELVNRGAWLGASSGLTSYEGIIEQVRAAAADADVKHIVLDVNSPGGEAYGMTDAARSIRAIAKATGKRIVAVVNAMAASAAYGLASAADEIVTAESGIAGSIGVALVHFDRSGELERRGVKATVITAGKLKAKGNPFGPLDEEAAATLRAHIETIMNGFVKLVADHRPKLTRDAVRKQEAGTFLGEGAVKAGLADRVGTFGDVIAELTGTRQVTTSIRSSLGRQDPASIELAAARAEGAAEAGARMAAILDHEAARGRELFARHLALNTSLPVDEAIGALEVSPAQRQGSSLAELMAQGPSTSLGAPFIRGPAQPVDGFQRGREIALRALGKSVN